MKCMPTGARCAAADSFLAEGWLVTKCLITAAVLVLVAEAAKRSDRLGGLLAALPLVTVPALIGPYVERRSQEKIANHAWYLRCDSLQTHTQRAKNLQHGVVAWLGARRECLVQAFATKPRVSS